jgi:ABC-type branched-subunit amino acid transport system substrate-binding protein
MKGHSVTQGWRSRAVIVAVCTVALVAASAPFASAKGAKKTDLTEAQASELVLKSLGPIKPATGNTTRGIDGKVITLSGVATIKGATGAETYPGLCDATNARLERANREGGVNGYTFKYLGCEDDQGDPTKDRQAVQDAVETKKVFALMPYISFVSDPTYPTQQHLPYFGFGLGKAYCGWQDTQYGFSTTSAESCLGKLKDGSSLFSNLALATYLKAAGKKAKDVKLAVVASQDATAAKAVGAFNAIAKQMGMDVVYAKTPIPAAGQPPLTDYTPVATDIKSSGANFTMEIFGDISQLTGTSTALKAQGYDGDLMNFSLADKRVLGIAPLTEPNDGSYVLMPQAGNGIAYPSATFKQIQADLDAIGKNDVEAGGLGAQFGYAAADVFLSALKKVDGPLTTEKLANVINAGFQYPGLGNSICPITFPAAHVMPSNCSAVVVLDAGGKTFKKALDLGTYGKIYNLTS